MFAVGLLINWGQNNIDWCGKTVSDHEQVNFGYVISWKSVDRGGVIFLDVIQVSLLK